jgi:hypothetical protein
LDGKGPEMHLGTSRACWLFTNFDGQNAYVATYDKKDKPSAKFVACLEHQTFSFY